MKAKALILAGLCGLVVALALAMTAGSASANAAFHNRFSFPGEMARAKSGPDIVFKTTSGNH